MIIYKTINLINKKFYIGKDSNNNPSYYGSGIYLKRAIKKYGRENFEKVILEKCANEKELNEREKYWIKELNATNTKIGYNLATGGEGCNILYMPIKKQIKHKKSIILAWRKRKKRMLAKIYTEAEKNGFKKSSKTRKENHKKFGLTFFEIENYKKISKRKRTGNFTEKELLNYKKISERKNAGEWTEMELKGYKKSSKTKRKRIKKSGLTEKEKIGHKKAGIDRKKRIKKYGFTMFELSGHKKMSINNNGIKNPRWLGFIYIYKNNNLLYKFNTSMEVEKFLKIDSQQTLKKILNEKYLDLKKHPLLKSKLSNFDGCEFIQSKEILN